MRFSSPSRALVASALHALVEQYALCMPGTEETVDIINAMVPADALKITHYRRVVIVEILRIHSERNE